MTQETIIGLLPTLGWLCWWATGRGVLGTKIWRREIFPIACGILALASGLVWWRALLGVITADIAHRMPYWDDDPIFLTLLTTICIGGWVVVFGAPLIFWPVISGWFFISSIISHKDNNYTWAWTEAITGLLQGIAVTVGIH